MIEEILTKKLIKLRLENSERVINKYINILKHNFIKSLKEMIKKRKNFSLDFFKIDYDKEYKCVVAFSGGIDSSLSVLISKYLFDIDVVSCYSPVINDKNEIKEIGKKLNVKVKFIDIDLEDIYKEALLNRYHPCGRCHKLIENTVINYAKSVNANFIIFGDLLAFGNQSLYKIDNNLFRFNINSFFALTKNEEREILKNFNINVDKKYGCKMLEDYHTKNKSYKFTIQRILREVRGRVITPEEGYKNILEVLNYGR
ncbi:hypothetical protein ACPB8Q_02125 [Methanocaldococcus indicus]|uniref:hypothetical protein n=1 Tax=Methanocaldococcus indicus TaxID=213231 RepID=UPI003C6D26F9